MRSEAIVIKAVINSAHLLYTRKKTVSTAIFPASFKRQDKLYSISADFFSSFLSIFSFDIRSETKKLFALSHNKNTCKYIPSQADK
jgi:hypothetical protein